MTYLNLLIHFPVSSVYDKLRHSAFLDIFEPGVPCCEGKYVQIAGEIVAFLFFSVDYESRVTTQNLRNAPTTRVVKLMENKL
jgi:hypothetical protein